jgi:hypothetical protein
MNKLLKRLLLAFGIALIVGGAGLLLSIWYFSAKVNSLPLKPVAVRPITTQTLKQPDAVSGKPVHFSVPSLNMELPIVDGYYTTLFRTIKKAIPFCTGITGRRSLPACSS